MTSEPTKHSNGPAGPDITGQLARYMAVSGATPLPDDVAEACKHRILDTIAAMVSGARMHPGVAALAYVRSLGGTPQATVMASEFRTNAVNAALANAMFAHADETDDFEPSTKAHPGSSAVPAALAMAEKNGSSGDAVIRSVAPLAGLNESGMRHAISYAAQQVSGLWSWVKDKDHVEKAFDFAGMGARNGVMAVTMVESGMTGVHDVLDGTHNLFIALSSNPRPALMVEDLGSRFYVAESAIKTFSVGYPNQSALDAVLQLRRLYDVSASNVRSILVKLPTDAIGIVATSSMPDVCCPHLVSLALLKGAVSFQDSHDAGLMDDSAILDIRRKVTVLGDEALMDPAAPRGAVVELELTDGRRVRHHTRFAPGNKERPLSRGEVNAKARDLMAPVLGLTKAEELIGTINGLERVQDIRTICHLWAA